MNILVSGKAIYTEDKINVPNNTQFIYILNQTIDYKYLYQNPINDIDSFISKNNLIIFNSGDIVNNIIFTNDIEYILDNNLNEIPIKLSSKFIELPHTIFIDESTNNLIKLSDIKENIKFTRYLILAYVNKYQNNNDIIESDDYDFI
jgi:hypothetical protein